MYRNQKPTAAQSVAVKQFPFLTSGINLVEALLRLKNKSNLIFAFQRLHQNSLSLAKKTTQLALVINKIRARRNHSYKNSVFGLLYQLKISDVLTKRQKINNLKSKSKSSGSSIIANLMARNIQAKILQIFRQLKNRTALIAQRNTFKILNLLNSAKAIEQKLLRNAFKIIKLKSFDLLAKYKRCFTIQSFYARKRVQNLTLAIDRLKINKLSNQQKHKHPSVLEEPQLQEANLIKELEQQKKHLQSDLNQLKNTYKNNLKIKQSQVQKMQSEYQSLRFNFDVMTQENSEMVESINERERLASQAQTRKKQHEQALQNRRFIPERVSRFNEHQMWQKVFDNLMLYLYQLKTGYNRQIFGLETLLEKMTQPLIRLSVYAESSQLRQQNQVLRDLLNSYRAAFNKNPSEGLQGRQGFYPLQILNKQRRYLYMALNCLTRWGTTQAQGLEEIKVLLDKIQKSCSANQITSI